MPMMGNAKPLNLMSATDVEDNNFDIILHDVNSVDNILIDVNASFILLCI